MGLERRDRVRRWCDYLNWKQEEGDAYDQQAVRY